MSIEELPLHEGGFRAIYTGVAVYGTRLLERLPEGRVSGLVTHAIAPALREGERLCWAEPEGLWVDCGTIEEVLRADVYARSLAVLAS
jgi:NDP-sugar pyrophosphorylase family protein